MNLFDLFLGFYYKDVKLVWIILYFKYLYYLFL